jgi:hypothetical protein
MRSLSKLSLCVVPFLAATFALAQQSEPFCEQTIGRCVDLPKVYTYDKKYVGHDEPSLLFYSNKPGSGNSNRYFLRLPKDPPTLPKQNGTGGTFNAQLHGAFWLGMAVCDTQSFPEYTSKCTPDSDSNIFDSRDPDLPGYIGHHPGTAFVEMQFYAPGFVLWPAGDSCDATHWCAALNIDSFGFDPNTNLDNNSACLSTVGEETVNFAFITKDGNPHAPANPLDATLATFTPNPKTDLFMNSGDVLEVQMYDTSEGLEVVVNDLTTHQRGSMKASAKNTFGQVKFDPYATSCKNIPYDFHPMYSTSSEHTRVPWAVHSYNIGFSDEIGHFEYCSSVDGQGGNCTKPGSDADDTYCFTASASSRMPVGGCLGADLDFDGPPYGLNWPGTSSNQAFDRAFHPRPIQFTSPLFKSKAGDWENYNRVGFETDLPVFEKNCNPFTGSGCENPPPGAKFYPIYSTAYVDPDNDNDRDACVWQLGGVHIPGTTNTFGGTAMTEYGSLLALSYPLPGGSITEFSDYRRVLSHNACSFAPRR